LSISTKNKNFFYKIKKDIDNIVNGVFLTRDLVSEPPNYLNPQMFVNEIKKLSKLGLKVEVFDHSKMKKIGMNALLGVAQGSKNFPYFVTIKWKPNNSKNKKPLSFIGKGVCFDTGGISLKPAKFMEDMKYDMAGAGAVVGLMKTLALRKSKSYVIGTVALVENMPGGSAQRPGDIVKSYSGKTIEVLNTDAEGRLILADAIYYIDEQYNPEFIIDLATLTGAIVVSLGNEYAGLFSNDDKLSEKLINVGEIENEKLWRFPLHKNYDKLMDSKIADIQNINYSGGAGSITAAQFLQRFLKNKTSWAHLDIAGMAWTKKDLDIIPTGATGFGVKLLNKLVEKYYD
jgi:leucyl aminopeptidase